MPKDLMTTDEMLEEMALYDEDRSRTYDGEKSPYLENKITEIPPPNVSNPQNDITSVASFNCPSYPGNSVTFGAPFNTTFQNFDTKVLEITPVSIHPLTGLNRQPIKEDEYSITKTLKQKLDTKFDSTVKKLRSIEPRDYHDNKKKHRCKWCLNLFRTNTELMNHINRNHICDYSYVCNIDECDKRYTTAATLRLHIYRHHNKSLHICSHCKLRYTSEENLRYHIATEHK
jgi:hypothetical protein